MKKKKSILMAILTVVLSVAMLMGTMTVSAFAAGTGYSGSNITGSDSTPATFPSQLEYGVETTDFSGATKIVEPNGNEVTSLAAYTPKQIGAYTVYYNKYSYVVPCKLEKDYELRVENNGADIATNLRTGGTLTLPKASVWTESDEQGVDYEEVTDAGFEVYSKVVGLETEGTLANEARTVTLSSASAYNIHYYCKVKGGTKYLYKDYTVKVQDDFTDDTNPTLSVVNVPSEISLNTKVTLPKATVTDNYDQNVKVTITVEEYDKETNTYSAVKEVELDENGYAKAPAADAKAVVFDNDYNLSFYPTKLTTYRIVYNAVDDNGNQATSTHSYTTTAVDKTAPVLKEIADENIPTKWGITSVAYADPDNSNQTLTRDNRKITFPYPEYVDNGNGNITVIFEIKDTVNNQTVIRFSNIYDYTKNEDGTYTAGNNAKYSYNENSSSNGLYDGTDIVFSRDGFEFDFDNYFKNLADGKTKTGTYTVSYQARDSVPNITTKTYDIQLEDTFSDTEKPDVKDVTFDDYYVVTGTKQEITIPTIRVSDNEDSRPLVRYELKSGEDSILVDGGEKAELELLSGVPTLTVKYDNKKDETLVLENELVYKITATDDAGNVSVKSNEGDAVQIVSTLDKPNAIDAFAFNTGDNGVTELGDKAYTVKQGEKPNVGGFTWAVAKEDREFYGFELSLVADNKLVSTSNISLLTYYDNAETNPKVHVEDIEFAVPDAEFVDLYIRVFNVAGVSITTKVNFAVESTNDDDKTTNSAVNISTTGSVYTTYTLQNKEFSTPSDIVKSRDYGVRKISGQGKFSLMGNQFTAYNAGSFKFVDGYYKAQSETDTTGVFTPLTKNSEYPLTVTESATPVWQVQGEMPTYTELSTTDKKVYVTLPSVVATTDYANARIELSVTDPDSNKLTVAPSKTDNDANKYKVTFNTDGNYQFEATKDGTYTVTYTAYYGDNSKLSESYSIKAGDVVAPTFAVEAPNARATENSTFTFKEISLSSKEDIDTSGSVRYKKTLKAPDGSEVYTVEGQGETYRKATTPTDTDAYKFTKIGNYTVEYTVYDKVGNSAVRSYTITVVAAKVNNPISTKIISTILIIVGVLLIAGVILYFVRFRKVKSK